MRTTAILAAPCSAAPNARALDTGGAMDADTRGFVNPMHAEDEEEDAQGEPDEQQENEDRS